MPDIITPLIPETITVHLGAPDTVAENVQVPFVDYIKNVVSSEIYPNWPENAIRANTYAIITYALNRIYTEYYRARGYDFDITNSTSIDQAFVPNRDIYENIDRIVNDIFNDYVAKQGTVNPFFTQFCNGTTSTCNGLSQWGTVTLANQGLTPYEILQRYYGNDINIIENAPVADIEESYPGFPLRLGDAGNEVEIIQEELNRIGDNYPAIPKIPNPNGVFDVNTEAAVKAFQQIFNLTQSGEVDKATWYQIKRYYAGVKKLSELVSEGVSIQEAQVPFVTTLKEESSGDEVRLVQYLLNILAYFNGTLSSPPIDGFYGPSTTQAVRTYQEFYGLTPTGEVNRATWNSLRDTYITTVGNLPQGYSGKKAKLFPGYFLSEGLQNNDVTDLQTYLSLIGEYYPEIPKVAVTGYFGPQTKAAVETFQRLFGLEPTGIVFARTWSEIAKQYDFLVETENL